MSAERVPYPELDCSIAMSRTKGNLRFLQSRLKEEWKESHTTAQAINDAMAYLEEAEKEYYKVLTLLRESNKL